MDTDMVRQQKLISVFATVQCGFGSDQINPHLFAWLVKGNDDGVRGCLIKQVKLPHSIQQKIEESTYGAWSSSQ